MDDDDLTAIHALREVSPNSSDQELHNLFGTERGALLLRAAQFFLLPEHLPTGSAVDSEAFIKIIRESRKKYSEGSEQLSNTLIRAYRYKKSGDVEKEMATYKYFLSVCRIPFYCEIARAHLGDMSCSE